MGDDEEFRNGLLSDSICGDDDNANRTSMYVPMIAKDVSRIPGLKIRGLPMLPRAEYHLDMYLMKAIWQKAERSGYVHKKKIHVAMWRRCVRRMLDVVDPELQCDMKHFHEKDNKPLVSWSDIRHGINQKCLPSVTLNHYEVLIKIMNGDTTCILGRVFAVLDFSVILINVGLLLVQSLHSVSPDVFEELNDICIIYFSVEYLTKLVCAPFVRRSVFDAEHLVEHAVPDPKNVYAVLPVKATGSERTLMHVFSPMNLVDAVSILPFWLNVVLGCVHMPLGFLRALRLLRLFRLLKFGKFSATLAVLGTTMRKSVQSMVVILIYIMMVSMLAGFIIHQFENRDAPAFKDVPSALWWVTARLVGMQHSLPGAQGIPETAWSAFILAWVGMFKGVIFVLPIGQISAAFKESWEDMQRNQRLQEDVAAEIAYPVGSEWTQDPNSPCVRMELVADAGQIAGVGFFNVPLFKKSNVDARLYVPLLGTGMRGFFGGSAMPAVEIDVSWKPSAATMPEMGLPRGKLELKLVSGNDFRETSSFGQQWQIRVHVPVHLYGKDAVEVFVSQWSRSRAPQPEWEEGKTFEISWAEELDPEQLSQQVFSAIDEDGDGALTKREFVSAIRRTSSIMAELSPKPGLSPRGEPVSSHPPGQRGLASTTSQESIAVMRSYMASQDSEYDEPRAASQASVMEVLVEMQKKMDDQNRRILLLMEGNMEPGAHSRSGPISPISGKDFVEEDGVAALRAQLSQKNAEITSLRAELKATQEALKAAGGGNRKNSMLSWFTGSHGTYQAARVRIIKTDEPLEGA